MASSSVNSYVILDPSRPHLTEPGQRRPVRVYDWTPQAADRTPLVVVSHGTGGSGRDMGWLAEPLAAAGFRVLSLDHHGNNSVDDYVPEGFLHPWERARDVRWLLDTLECRAPLGPVGVAGFSIGGWTAMALAGARVDTDVVRAVLSGAVTLDPIEEMPDALPRLLERTTPADVDVAVEHAGADLRDPRVTAAFAVAPGGTALFRQESLAAVGVPVGLRWGGADTVNPAEQDVRPLLDAVPGATGAEIGPDVTHHDLIAPLTPGSAGVRARVGADAVAFFDTHLRGAAAPTGPLL